MKHSATQLFSRPSTLLLQLSMTHFLHVVLLLLFLRLQVPSGLTRNLHSRSWWAISSSRSSGECHSPVALPWRLAHMWCLVCTWSTGDARRGVGGKLGTWLRNVVLPPSPRIGTAASIQIIAFKKIISL